MQQSDTSLQPIDAARAWGLIRAAADLPPEAAGTRTCTSDGRSIKIAPGGEWSSRCDVSPEAARLFDIFLPVVASGTASTVLAQVGQSLDGFIATETGHSHYVTGEAGLAHLHRLRALCDVVVVGAGTAIADDPQLTVRRVEGRNPVRAVIDPRGRVPGDRRMFHDGAARTLILTDSSLDDRPAPGEAEPVALKAVNGAFRPQDILSALTEQGFCRILIEGGGITISRFLEARVLDRLHVVVAPLLIGSGRPALTLPPVARLDDALRPPCRRYDMGEDVLFDLELEPIR